MKAIFDIKSESAYDDDIANRYHFPRRYLDLVSQTAGDWVIFRQPRAGGGSKAYFAVGRVVDIIADSVTARHFYAVIADFLPFDRLVAWRDDGRYAEEILRGIENVPQVGVYMRGRSVRPLGYADFVEIVSKGFGETLDPANAAKLGLDSVEANVWEFPQVGEDEEERARVIVQVLLNRKVREASFRNRVCTAYDNRCAVTGLRIINGGGRAEVQAAHIWPVGEGGPDTIQNGIALSATVHWLFDRHLISLADDYSLLVSHNKVPTELLSLFGDRATRIGLPNDSRLWPRASYLARHREAFAGG